MKRIKKTSILIPTWLLKDYFLEACETFKKSQQKRFKDIEKEFGEKIFDQAASRLKNPRMFEDWDREVEEEGQTTKQGVKEFLVLVHINDLGHIEDFFYNSFFVLLVAFVENKLGEICNKFYKQNKLKLKVGDIKGKGVYRARLFLTRVCGLNFPSQGLFNQIDLMCKLRNKIVHADSKINKKEKMYGLFKSMGLTIHPDPSEPDIEKIHLEKDFCNKTIEKVEEFFKELFVKNKEILERIG